MALATLQYFKMRQLMRDALAVEGTVVADADLLSFFKQALGNASGVTAPSPALRSFLFGESCRTMLSGDGTTPSDADLQSFWQQMQIDSSSSVALSSLRYRTLMNALRGRGSCDSVNPLETDVLGYLNSVCPQFPSTITGTDIVVWMDGRLTAYSDAAGTIPVTSGLIRRINDSGGTPWSSENDPQRPTRDLGIRCDFLAGSGFGQLLRSPSTSISLNSWTMIAQFVVRDGNGGPNMGLCATSATTLGLFAGSGILGCYVNNAPVTIPGITVPTGQKCTAIVTCTSTTVSATLLSGGVTQTGTISTAVTGGTTGSNGWHIAPNFGNMNGLYGSINQFLAIGRVITPTEIAQALTWGDSLSCTDGYPLSAPLVCVAGDSIPRNFGVPTNQGWVWMALQNMRAATVPNAEVCNVAVAGSGIALSTYSPLFGFASPARAKNIVVLAGGTNDLANGVSASTEIANYFAACDALRAAGFYVVACTILPRSDPPPVGQGAFNAARAIVNPAIVAGKNHYNALADVASILGMGADGDSNGVNYQGDHIHPAVSGHALIEPVYRAAILTLLP